MQNKKSVLFVEPEDMLSPAKSIKKELVKGSDFVGIVIAEKKLRCLVKNYFFDKIAPEGSSLRRTYKKLRRKLIMRRPESITYGDACGLPQKTVRNLLYRFVPDVVVVSTEEALRSILVERKKLGIKCNVCVLCREQIDVDIVSEDVNFYFAGDLAQRNDLATLSVDVDRIVIGTSASYAQQEEEEKRISAKRNFGLEKEKAVLYCVENCEEALAEAIREKLSAEEKGEYDTLFLCGADSKMAEMVSECGGRVVGDKIAEDLAYAIDLVVVRPDSAIAEEFKKFKVPVVDFTQETLSDENVLTLLTQKKSLPSSSPNRIYADCLQKMLEEKLNAEPIEPEEEPEKWIPQEEDEDD